MRTDSSSLSAGSFRVEPLKPSARRALKWYSAATKEQRQDFHGRWGVWHTDEARGYAKDILDAFCKSVVPSSPSGKNL